MNPTANPFCNLLITASVLLAFLAMPRLNVVGQTNDQLWQTKSQLDDELRVSVGELVDWCRENELQAAEPVLQRFVVVRNEDRQYIFLAPENQVESDGLPSEWPDELKSKTRTLLDEHSGKLFEMAKQLVAADQGSRAIQLLNEMLFFSTNDRNVRKMLGHREIELDGVKHWQVSKDRLKSKPARKQHSKFGWPAKSWTITSTQHFQIESRATPEQTEFLARKLERWQEVWRQMFFDYYNRASNIQRWIDGKTAQRPTTRKFKVLFFADRDEYVAELSRSIPGVEASTGYYDDRQKVSYFYASDKTADQDTWRHELTHQLFQESRQSVKSPFQEQFLWLGEGIAMYFESLVDHGSYVTLGGFDARRLQYARLRRLKEQFRFPLDRLSGLELPEFQSQSEVTKIYSQSAGVTHYLMDSDHGSMQKPLTQFLELAYRGRLKTGVFEKLIGKSFDQVETEYESFLKVKPEQLATLAAAGEREELMLIGTKLQEDSLALVGDCVNLQWLDLSGCDVRGERLRYLKSCTKLRQLFLTGSRLDDDAVEIISKLPVGEIDLSGSNLSDAQLDVLIGSKALKTLNVASSRVTSHGVKTVGSKRPDIELGSNFNQGN